MDLCDGCLVSDLSYFEVVADCSCRSFDRHAKLPSAPEAVLFLKGNVDWSNMLIGRDAAYIALLHKVYACVVSPFLPSHFLVSPFYSPRSYMPSSRLSRDRFRQFAYHEARPRLYHHLQ